MKKYMSFMYKGKSCKVEIQHLPLNGDVVVVTEAKESLRGRVGFYVRCGPRSVTPTSEYFVYGDLNHAGLLVNTAYYEG